MLSEDEISLDLKAITKVSFVVFISLVIMCKNLDSIVSSILYSVQYIIQVSLQMDLFFSPVCKY